ncbi:HAD family phosphatase [uncultured Lactobacillus sp.]|uniref:HAD family hydrolase n=1 Tax=uncultured Lactobacillus sp. TaxID=153152 RepID=UPI002638BF94|nr:HAD family phosphatase [uncultured Lactobacillus sp.]
MKFDGLKDNISGLIFDMDGLLVNSERLYWQANIQAAKEYNLNIPEDSYLKLVGSSAKDMENFYHKYFKTTELRDEFIKRTDDLVWQWADEGKLRLRPGVQEALDYFDQQGMKMSIASSNYNEYVEKFLWVTGIRQYFVFHLSYKNVLQDHLEPKPAPDIYLLAQKKMELPKNQLLVFEDSSTGVTAAHNAGLDCIMVPDLKPATEVDREDALICKDFYEVIDKIK